MPQCAQLRHSDLKVAMPRTCHMCRLPMWRRHTPLLLSAVLGTAPCPGLTRGRGNAAPMPAGRVALSSASRPLSPR